MAAAQLPPSDSLAPPHRRRLRRLVFDRRYGWIFDEWTDPAEQALSGGRGMFCAVTMARSLVNAAASSINNVSSSVSRILQSSNSFCLPAYVPNLAFNKKQQAWLRELEKSGVVADLKSVSVRCNFLAIEPLIYTATARGHVGFSDLCFADMNMSRSLISENRGIGSRVLHHTCCDGEQEALGIRP